MNQNITKGNLILKRINLKIERGLKILHLKNLKKNKLFKSPCN